MLCKKKAFNEKGLEEDIKKMEEELNIQIAISKDLDKDTEEKISEATEFFESKKDLISGKLLVVKELSEDLKAIVNENKKNKSLDKQYDELVNSENYKNIAKDMKDIRDSVSDLKSFLEKNGILKI